MKKQSLILSSLGITVLIALLTGCTIVGGSKAEESVPEDLSSLAPVSSSETSLSADENRTTVTEDEFDSLFGLNGQGYFFNENTNVTITAVNLTGIDEQVENMVGLNFRFRWVGNSSGDEIHIYNQSESNYPTTNKFKVYRKQSGQSKFTYASVSSYPMRSILREAGLVTPTAFSDFTYNSEFGYYHAEEIVMDGTKYYDIELQFLNGKLMKAQYSNVKGSTTPFKFTYSNYGTTSLPMEDVTL